MGTASEKATSGKQPSGRKVNVGGAERKASMIGGAALTAGGAAALAKKRFIPGIAMIAVGGMLAYRGKTGHCSLYEAIGVSTAGGPMTMEKSVTVNRPKEEVYKFWRKLENLPTFMKCVESVQITGDKSSHWKAAGPAGLVLEWDAEIDSEKPGEEISWKSVDGADVSNEGEVDFHEAPGGRGTEVHVRISFTPGKNAASAVVAGLADVVTSQLLEEDLKRFKQIMETGEIATEARM